MKLSEVLLDTSVIVAFKQDNPGNWVSAVVLQELITGARDKDDIQSLRLVMTARLKSGHLLVPDHEDWF